MTSFLEPRERCPRPTCHAADEACIDGLSIADCDDWNRARRTEDEQPTDPRGSLIPWNGGPLGSDDFHRAGLINGADVVAVVGAANAGKTTALAAFFQRLVSGHSPAGWHFAGSWTLTGWYSIARRLSWRSPGPMFPRHTTSNAERQPGLLHLALHQTGKPVRDLMFSDAPGEWFRDWAVNADASPGAGWLADRARAFVLLADAAALSGNNKGEERLHYNQLASRVASVAQGRPVLPMLSKSDLDMDPAARARIDEMHRRLFGASTRDLSSVSGAGALDALDDAVSAAVSASSWEPWIDSEMLPPALVDPFLRAAAR